MNHLDPNRHVRGESQYLDDVPVQQGTLYAAVFESPLAHGVLRSLDFSAALTAPGVARILTAADIPGINQIGGIVADEPALPPDAECKLEQDEITRAIEQVLNTMPPRQRQVAALRLRHQLPTAAIAEKLGISPRTVEVHVARATKALREQLPALLSGDGPATTE